MISSSPSTCNRRDSSNARRCRWASCCQTTTLTRPSQIQEQFLVNSKQPVHDARMHAMLCYRTPESFKERFKRSTNEDLKVFNVESWLMHHGEKLQQRFQLSAYKLMNQLLKTIDITRTGEVFQPAAGAVSPA